MFWVNNPLYFPRWTTSWCSTRKTTDRWPMTRAKSIPIPSNAAWLSHRSGRGLNHGLQGQDGNIIVVHEMVQWYFNESNHECEYVGQFHDGNGNRCYKIGLERVICLYAYHSIRYPMTLLSRMVVMVYHGYIVIWYICMYIYIIVEHQTWLIPSHDINHALDGYVMGILEHHWKSGSMNGPGPDHAAMSLNVT